MTRDQAVDILLRRLGNRAGSILQQAAIDEMVFAQENALEGFPELPWFLLSEHSTELTIPEEERVPLPTDFLGEWEDGGLYIQNTDGTYTALKRDDYDALLQDSSLVASNKPSWYDIVGDYYRLRAIPNAVYTLRLMYYQRAASLAGTYGDTNDIENRWLKYASDWLIAETGLVLATSLYAKLVPTFTGMVAEARARVMAKNTAMRESMKQRIMSK